MLIDLRFKLLTHQVFKGFYRIFCRKTFYCDPALLAFLFPVCVLVTQYSFFFQGVPTFYRLKVEAT